MDYFVSIFLYLGLLINQNTHKKNQGDTLIKIHLYLCCSYAPSPCAAPDLSPAPAPLPPPSARAAPPSHQPPSPAPPSHPAPASWGPLTGAGAGARGVRFVVETNSPEGGPGRAGPVLRGPLPPVQVAAAWDVGGAGDPVAQVRGGAVGLGPGARLLPAAHPVAQPIEALGAPRLHRGARRGRGRRQTPANNNDTGTRCWRRSASISGSEPESDALKPGSGP